MSLGKQVRTEGASSGVETRWKALLLAMVFLLHASISGPSFLLGSPFVSCTSPLSGVRAGVGTMIIVPCSCIAPSLQNLKVLPVPLVATHPLSVGASRH